MWAATHGYAGTARRSKRIRRLRLAWHPPIPMSPHAKGRVIRTAGRTSFRRECRPKDKLPETKRSQFYLLVSSLPPILSLNCTPFSIHFVRAIHCSPDTETQPITFLHNVGKASYSSPILTFPSSGAIAPLSLQGSTTFGSPPLNHFLHHSSP